MLAYFKEYLPGGQSKARRKVKIYDYGLTYFSLFSI